MQAAMKRAREAEGRMLEGAYRLAQGAAGVFAASMGTIGAVSIRTDGALSVISEMVAAGVVVTMWNAARNRHKMAVNYFVNEAFFFRHPRFDPVKAQEARALLWDLRGADKLGDRSETERIVNLLRSDVVQTRTL